MKILDVPAHPLEGKPAPVLAAGKKRGPCPVCKAKDWIERPDGTAVCYHCIRHAGCHGPNSNGDTRWCAICTDEYFRDLAAKQKAARQT
jgi:hypothetical protein